MSSRYFEAFRYSAGSLWQSGVVDRRQAWMRANFTAIQTVVNLAEQHGKEAVVVKAYEDAVKNMQNENVKYADFLFVLVLR